eukprot:846998-Pyramimonas_sp.AAC.1
MRGNRDRNRPRTAPLSPALARCHIRGSGPTSHRRAPRGRGPLGCSSRRDARAERHRCNSTSTASSGTRPA